MVKITPLIKTSLLLLFLISSFYTIAANSISSLLTPPESDTNVSLLKISTDEVSPDFKNFSTQKINLDSLLSLDISKRAIARFNSPINNEVNYFEITDLVIKNKQFELFEKPTISGINIPAICQGTTSAVLSYTSATPSANKYSIVFIGAARSQGFPDVTSQPRTFNTTGGSIPITVPTSAIAGSYTADFYLSNSEQSLPYRITIKINETPSVTTANAKTICSGASTNISLTPSTTNSFAWTVGTTTGNISGASSGTGSTINQTLTNPSNSTVGSVQYLVTPTSSTGSCVGNTYTITVTVYPKPFLTAGSNQPASTAAGSCTASVAVTNATFSNNCPSTIAYTLSGDTTKPSTTGQVGTYTFNKGVTTINYTVTDAAGNTATGSKTITVTDNIKPTITAPSATTGTTNVACTSTNVTLGSPVVSDNCTATGSLIITNNAPSPFPIGTTTVTWRVEDAAGNFETATQTVNVTDDVKPIISHNGDILRNNDPGQCYATISIIPATATDNCAVGNPTGTRDDGRALTADYPVGTTIIKWNVTDANVNAATEVTQSVTVSDNEAPIPPDLEDITWGCEYTVPTPVASDNCPGEITITADPSATFTSSGEYVITWKFTDPAGNSSTAIQKITINQISVSIDKTDILCNGASTGEVEAMVTGGVAPFTYDWGSQGAGPKKTGLGPGNYSVIVTDASGCTAEANETITEPATFVKINSVTINTGCNGANNASIIIDAEGGTGTLSYYLDGSALTDNTSENLSHKDYLVEVRDINGCSATQNISITEPAALAINEVRTTETTSFGSATGTATAIVGGGTKPYSYAWFNESGELLEEQVGQTAKDLIAGNYTVSVTDANECPINLNTAPFAIYDSLYSEISVSSKCVGDGGIQELRTSFINTENLRGGSGDYIIEWDFDSPMTVNGPDANGEYTVEYNSAGARDITLTIKDKGIKDSNGDEITYQTSLSLFVGECYGKCTAQDLDVGNYYLGSGPEGVPFAESAKCETITNEGIWVDLFPPSLNAKRHNFYAEYVIILYHSDGTLTEYVDTICRIGEIDTSKPQKIIDIDYKCGDIISLEKLFVSVSSSKNGGCNNYSDTNNPKCTGLEEPQEVPSPLSLSATGSQVLCLNNPNGQIAARAAGNQGDLQFTLTSRTDSSIVFTSPIQTKNTYLFTGLPTDDYDLTVIDNLENDSNLRPSKSDIVENIKITPPDNPLDLRVVSRVELSCSNGNDSEVKVTATGGKAPYIYTWEDGQTGDTRSNLSSGTTWVKVIDDNGCDNTLPIVIVAPVEVIADAGNDITLSCGVNKVVLDAIFPPYKNPVTDEEEFGEWSILNGPTGASFSPNKNSPNSVFTIQTSGTYTLRWTVPCGNTDDVKITFSNCSTLDFDGEDDHIDLGNNYNPTSTYTMEAWIRPLDLTGTKTILSKRDKNDLSKGGFDLIIENSYPKFRWNTSSSIASSYIIKTDRWYHIAVVIGGNDTGLYVDGIKVSAEIPGTPTSIDERFLIGAMNTSTDLINPENFFKGWIEEVRIWDTALTQKQLQFLMNQRVQEGVSPVQGTIIPNQDAYGLTWTNLTGYYRLIATDVSSGFTKDLAQNKIKGRLINILSTQKNTAPLPYVTAKSGVWNTRSTWAQPNDWDIPNSIGINTTTNDTINWNIVQIRSNDDITHINNNKELKLLGLLAEGNLTMDGTNSGPTLTSADGSGSGLNISRYLLLNGYIDFNGESQLVQGEESILDIGNNGYIMIDQQGTANSFNYNYWSSPVSSEKIVTSSGTAYKYKIDDVMKDGSSLSNNPPDINFQPGVTVADGAKTSPTTISTRWLYSFLGREDQYTDWTYIGDKTALKIGEGYTMKGTSGELGIQVPQNYTFKGKPNNGHIKLEVGPSQNYLIGNPYPSAISVAQFFKDNLTIEYGGTNDTNAFNGALYFWDHFGGESHDLREYVGGYSVRNKLGAVPAISNDERIGSGENNTGKLPGDYIPVGQGFFINTGDDISSELLSTGGTIHFTNKQRIYKTESQDDSQFLRPEQPRTKGSEENSKIRLDFSSPLGYHRQILVGTSEYATNGFDLGYDAPLNDYSEEDFFWLINNYEYVIQGVSNFNPDQVLPIGIYISKKGEFKIEINKLESVPEETNIYLLDLETEEYFDLRKSGFTMEIEPGAYYERFQIVFEKKDDESEEAEEEENEEESNPDGQEEGFVDPKEEPELNTSLDIVYMSANRELAIINPDNLAIQKVIIYNLLGQKIQEYEDIETKKIMTLGVKEFPMAVYLVKMYSEKGEVSKNIMLMR